MNLAIEITTNKAIPKLLSAMGAEGRRELYAVTVEDMANWITAHIRRYAPSKHATAHAFGAQPTRHYEAGMAAISTSATGEGGTVTIPIPGISRAWGNITITPKRAGALTIPLKAAGSTVYGRTVGELRALGWAFFAQKGVLFGTRGEGSERETVPMFVLKQVVNLRQDPSLLPSQQEIAEKAAKTMAKFIIECVDKARKEKAS